MTKRKPSPPKVVLSVCDGEIVGVFVKGTSTPLRFSKGAFGFVEIELSDTYLWAHDLGHSTGIVRTLTTPPGIRTEAIVWKPTKPKRSARSKR